MVCLYLFDEDDVCVVVWCGVFFVCVVVFVVVMVGFYCGFYYDWCIYVFFCFVVEFVLLCVWFFGVGVVVCDFFWCGDFVVYGDVVDVCVFYCW